MEVRTLKEEDYPEWDKFVEQSPQGDIFDYSWWLDTVSSSAFEIMALFDKGKIVAGIPLTYDEYGRINEPPLTRTLGILFTAGEGKCKISDQRKWALSLVEQLPVDKIAQFCTHHNLTDWLPFKWAGLSQTTRYTYIMDYSGKDESELWHGLNRGKKSIVNKAKHFGIRVIQSDEPAVAYSFLEKSYGRQGLKPGYSQDFLMRLDAKIKTKINRLILIAIGEDASLHSSIYVAWNKRSAYYLLSGSDPYGRKMGGHTLALWEAVKYLRDKTMYFNFGGSEIRKIEEHFSGFGGTMTPYFHIYNEKNLHSTDVRHHIGEIRSHSISLVNAFRRKFFNN